jgi:hypothetical protein
VLLAVFFLDKHASPPGIASLALCIGASTQYAQAPMRGGKSALRTATDPEWGQAEAKAPLLGAKTATTGRSRSRENTAEES